MRPFKHNKSSGSGGTCNCSYGYILLLIAFVFVSAYGLVIASIMTHNRGFGPATATEAVSSASATTSIRTPSSSLSAAFSAEGDGAEQSSSFLSSSSSASNTVPDPAPDDLLDTITAVVECKTTHGPLTIDVREHWGPLGAAQFLRLVDQGFFAHLPFFRVAPRYITQFGVKVQASQSAAGVKTIKDDTSLWGKRDMDFGYLFFAGNGAHSRRDQMVLALCEQEGCIQTALGKAPWEVPIGTVCAKRTSALSAPSWPPASPTPP
jgi:hypothetical protein